jgi:tetratricopeptide (TPR) repeat protein
MSKIEAPTVLNDRYQLGEELGRGGMGVVYRARDPTLDREVAVKVLSKLGLGTEGRARLLHEAQAIAKLSHPNIVPVFDAGESEESPYIVMEMIEGESLHDRPPEDLADIARIAAQVCAALEHAHKNGIVHRDLKPENVLIDSEGTAKLMDFGIARSMASRLTSEGQVVGTVFYLAPEIALGHEYDGRADLYSLGVMVYELTTGALPFVDGDPVAVISQHLHASVVPPRAKNPDIPPLLDTLILQLMSKDPDGRPSSAAATRQMLERDDLLDPQAKGEREVLVLDRIVRGRFIGRDQELSEARSLWSKAEAGEGQTLLVSGEPGIGKTRLMRELSTHVEVTGGRTLIGFCYEEGGAPYAPFAQILRKALRVGTENGFQLPDFVLADLLELAPELKPYYPDIPPNPVLEPDAEQQRLFENVVAFCSEVSQSAPLLLVLDDVHWADSGSLSLMRHLARRIRNKPILLLATYREIELDVARPFRQVMLALNRERLARRMKLSRLSAKHTAALLGVIFQEDISQEFLDGIYRETEGNPFFIEEVCKALIEEGQVFHTEDGWDRLDMDEMEIPQSVRDVVQARTAKLPEEFQDALTLAAVLGREFDFDTLVQASDLDEDTLIEALEAAEDAQLIQEVGGEGGATFSFMHALIPSTLVESVRTLRRRKLHRRAAAAIETLHPEDYESLAQHYEEAGNDEKARGYYMEAGKQSSRAYANQEAETYFRTALELNPSTDEQPGILAELAVVQARRGSFTEAIAAWKESAALYAASSNDRRVAWCYARMARAGWDSGDTQWGLELAEAAIDVLGASPDTREYADLLHETARAYVMSGLNEKAVPFLERALTMAQSTNDVLIQAEVLATQGLLASGTDEDLFAAQAALEEAIALSQAHNLPLQESRARNNLAHIVGPIRGDPREARELLRQATELSHLGGDVGMELFGGSHGANYGIWLGDLSGVENELDQLDALLEGSIRPGIGARDLRKMRLVLGFARGHTQETVAGLQLLLEELRETRNLYSYWEVCNYLAEALIELSEFDEAELAAQEAIDAAILDFTKESQSRSWKSIALAMRGEIEPARQMLQEARESSALAVATLDAVSVLRSEAYLATAEARWSDAWAAFEDATSRLSGMGMRLFRARDLRAWAKGHISRGEPEDIERACELLEEARVEFEDMGSDGYVERIDAQLAELQELHG